MASALKTQTMTANEKDQVEEQTEGKLARFIEGQTAKLPSDMFLWAACASILGSMAFQFSEGREHNRSLFVGQWVPTFLLLGIYNKIVKVAGSDRATGSR